MVITLSHNYIYRLMAQKPRNPGAPSDGPTSLQKDENAFYILPCYQNVNAAHRHRMKTYVFA